jgi:hypothetical protein
MEPLKPNGQAGQDVFVLSVLKRKRDGFYIDIGANMPKQISNSWPLDTDFGWNGVLVEYDRYFYPLYEAQRPRPIVWKGDASKLDYATLFQEAAVPADVDYLQIDLEVHNRSTLDTLKRLDEQVMDKHRFATITFEHDIYRGNHHNTRQLSREIFERRGYVLVFPDVQHEHQAFEDWWVHPDLVDMDYVNRIKQTDSMNYHKILAILRYADAATA